MYGGTPEEQSEGVRRRHLNSPNGVPHHERDPPELRPARTGPPDGPPRPRGRVRRPRPPLRDRAVDRTPPVPAPPDGHPRQPDPGLPHPLDPDAVGGRPDLPDPAHPGDPGCLTATTSEVARRGQPAP